MSSHVVVLMPEPDGANFVMISYEIVSAIVSIGNSSYIILMVVLNAVAPSVPIMPI